MEVIVMRNPMVLVVLFIALVAVSCGEGEDHSSLSATESYSGFIAASEFVVGQNRFPFILVTIDGATLEGADVRVAFSRMEGETETPYSESNARWLSIPENTVHVHPDGDEHLHLDFRGIYVVDPIDFPQEGVWVASFDAWSLDGERLNVSEGAGFRVAAIPGAPDVGETVPATENLTIHDVDSFAKISTRQVERDELHNVSVAQALDAGEPFVVVIASPQFCVSAMCGPVIETVDAARVQLARTIEFIHIEPWDLTAAREQGQLVPRSIVAEWSLPSEPWTYVIGADGRVVKRFEGLVSVDEIVAAVELLF